MIGRKIATAFATGALIFNAFATSAFAATTLEISGNGTHSDNTATVSVTNSNTVVQSNNADVTNKVNVDADTGGNKANDNTGGNVSIDTGNVSSTVDVTNTLNANSATVNCCPSNTDTNVLISGNGSNSDNNVDLTQSSSNSIFQNNNANVDNKVKVSGDTGDNRASDNTGGDVSVTTGNVDTSVSLSTSGNVNSARIGNGDNGGGSLSARIIGNGTHSDNNITLDWGNDTTIVQSNNADVDNDVKVDADTGGNRAKDNTGGDVVIDTGDVTTDVTVDNMVNFNFADANCGCLLDDVLAKIAGNGSDSDSTIDATLDSSQQVFQDNCGENHQVWELGGPRHEDCGIDNNVRVNADTGDNKGEDNTGSVDNADPDLTTGNVDTTVDLQNSGNVNVLGNSDITLPEFDFGFNFSLDLSDLLDWLASHGT